MSYEMTNVPRTLPPNPNGEIERQATRIAQLERENERLRAALKPFAEFADRTHRAPECLIITNGSPLAKSQLRMSDCYRAAEAIAHEQAVNPKGGNDAENR